uniref:glucuronosyltransferase n=1 Tax=Caenorhabditis tropicalis TaxID=1561998 RepID=A0A1I7TBN8_9PELO
MARLADTLTEANHSVTFFMPIFDETRKDQLGVKLTKDVIILNDPHQETFTIDNITETFWHINVNSNTGHHLFEPLRKQTVSACRNIFQSKELIEKLAAKKFDVAIAEPVMSCGLALFRHLGIEKVVMSSSCPNYDNVLDAMGEPAETSYWPSIFSEASGDQMSFSERIENYDMYHVMVKIYNAMQDDEIKMVRSIIGEDFPGWRQLIADASLHFTNSIPYLDFPRASIQKTVDIGGITVDIEAIKPLSSKWDDILNKRPKNMFLSFGSLAKSCEMPMEFKKNLLEVFRSEPDVTFIWKYESEDVEFGKGVENVEFVKWAPQTSLLNDDRVNAFLGHGGLGSTYETTFLGKPSIMVPIFFDQTRNSHMLRRLETSITLHKRDIGDFKKLKSAFHEILHNKKYAVNAAKVAQVVRDQPLTPKQILVKYVEFVGKYGPFHHMTPYGLKMPWYQRYSYDVYVFKFFMYLFPILIGSVVVKYIFGILTIRIVKRKE